MKVLGATRFLSTAAVTIAACATPAFSDLYLRQTGPIEPKGSWLLPLGFASTTTSIDMIGVQITTGAPFDTPAVHGLDAGWSQTLNSGMLAAAAGPGSNMVGFVLHFSGELTDPVEFDVAAFSNGEFVGAYHGSWSGSGHFVELTASDWMPSAGDFGGDGGGDGNPVPAPGAGVLALLGMGCMALVTRRRA